MPQRSLRSPERHWSSVGFRALTMYLPNGSSLPPRYSVTPGVHLSLAICCQRFSSGGAELGPYSAEISTLLVISNRCGWEQGSGRIALGLSGGQSRQVLGGELNAASASSEAVDAA